MNRRFYSKTTGTTYLEGIHAGSIPSDAVEIPSEVYRSVILSPAPGKIRSHDEEGLPILIDAPPVDIVSPVLRTFKTDVWSRATEDEAEIIDGALATQPVRSRRMWDDCQSIEHDSEMFATLQAQMNQVFGEERTEELLAHSEGA